MMPDDAIISQGLCCSCEVILVLLTILRSVWMRTNASFTLMLFVYLLCFKVTHLTSYACPSAINHVTCGHFPLQLGSFVLVMRSSL